MNNLVGGYMKFLIVVVLLLNGCSTYQMSINRDIISNGKNYGSVGINLDSYGNSYIITDKNTNTSLRIQGNRK